MSLTLFIRDCLYINHNYKKVKYIISLAGKPRGHFSVFNLSVFGANCLKGVGEEEDSINCQYRQTCHK